MKRKEMLATRCRPAGTLWVVLAGLPLLFLLSAAADPGTDGVNLAAEIKLTASDAATGDFFGRAVSVDGDTIVVGAYLDDDRGVGAGSAYVFRRNEAGWAQEAKLTANDGNTGDLFGWSVSVDGDTIVVGAYGDDAGFNFNSGSAYVFRRSGTEWVQEQKLIAQDRATEDFFGWSVSVDGETVVVGAYGSDESGLESGSAYVFRRSLTGWAQDQKLTASDAATGDFFGRSVSVEGDFVAAGAPRDDGNGSGSGSTYVFRRSGTDWVEDQKITASDGAAADAFGESVSLTEQVLVVGAHGDDETGTRSGSAYVFSRDGTRWVQSSKILARDGARFDSFGHSVAASGDSIVVGAFRDDDRGFSSGSAYVFRQRDAGWLFCSKLTASDGVAGDEFGRAVSVGGQNIVIGAYHDDHVARASGSAYVYRTNCLPIADAGGDRETDCTSPQGALVTLDGSSSADGDSTPGTNDDLVLFEWFLDSGLPSEAFLGQGQTLAVTLPPGRNVITLRVTDGDGATDTDDVVVLVDTTPPSGSITAPLPGSCHGPASRPVTVEDNFTDLCDPNLERIYDPPPGPRYGSHGDLDVELTVVDTAGNSSSDSVSFTMDLRRPFVHFLRPPPTMLIPSTMPFSKFFEARDFDGASGDVVLERAFWDDCLVYDGLTYGDGDGLLRDEVMVFDRPSLCEAVTRCGLPGLNKPVVRVEVLDCGDNLGTATRIIPVDPELPLVDCQ